MAFPPQHIPHSSRHGPPCPWIPIPDQRIICIEHPAIIQNIDKGIATLGGEKALVKLASTNGNSGLMLRFRPDDPMQPPIQSRTVPSNSVLVKITVPRRRRKKRRDAEGRAVVDPRPVEELPLLEKLRKSNGKYKVETVGMIERTVRFRDMANYQFNTSRSPFVAKIKSTVLDCSYPSLQQFALSPGKGHQPILEILPPPSFSNTVMQHTYYYRQNPAIKKALIAGKPALLNLQAAPKTLTPMVHISSPNLPSKPLDIRPYETLDAAGKKCVDHLRALFAQRPIWTRRALFNHFPKNLQSLVRFSMVHVAYMWRAGPWRDTCVIYGLDPRSSPEYRKYQSVFFQVETEKSQKGKDDARKRNSHIFDGKQLVRDGRCFQLCDVTDPLLCSLIETGKVRRVCDMGDGWYRASTMAKIKAIMRGKIRSLAEGTVPADSEFVDVLEQESESESEEKERKEREVAERAARKMRRLGREAAAEAAEAEVEAEEAEAVEEAADNDGEWEEELTEEQRVDGRVEELMMELLKQGGEHAGYEGYLEDVGEEGDFDVLEGEEDED
ncbi:uncharacterized protein LAJ45_08170 [Morchella importuna]|uniref:Transcription factor IIIC subunit 5 HTH domain-containing protein n=1 Tax=Morchella conica CCBAS932 TaxID=1392247 RepID=A0A3N4KIQ1_9PEZI|nr:uncharacterized protein LAJ45_08170 [Morchella importuna]KAH8147705.1 hypothetical protein LAJ45_08170 [Morchella importuna]RPB10436.1 hypothetical protein P167DRAFT_525833 [Morchella conica CCBAS932]